MAEGFCVEFCRIGEAGCGADRTCLQFFPHARLGGVEHGYCSSRCEVLTDVGCVAGTSCQPFVDNRVAPPEVFTVCRPIGAGADGDVCANYEECGAAMACTGGTCRPLCDVAVPSCSGGRTCQPLDPPTVSAGRTIGSCG